MNDLFLLQPRFFFICIHSCTCDMREVNLYRDRIQPKSLCELLRVKLEFLNLPGRIDCVVCTVHWCSQYLHLKDFLFFRQLVILMNTVYVQ